MEDYLAQTVHALFPPHNPVDFSPKMGTAQEQALGNERFGENQALFRRCTAIDGAIKKLIGTVVQQFFLLLIMDNMTGFRQVTAIEVMQNLFRSYGSIG